MGIFGPTETGNSKPDPELALLEKERAALWQEEYKETLKREVEELKRKHGDPNVEASKEDKVNAFFVDRGIQVTNLKERRSGSTSS